MRPAQTAALARLGGHRRRPSPLHRTTRITLAILLALSHPLWAATIIVDETACTLVDAMTAANTDSAAGGCPAGSGADTIELTTDVSLTAVNNGAGHHANGLPRVVSEITVEGGGFSIRRDATPSFRLFMVLANGSLTLNDVTLQQGYSTYLGGGILNDSGTLTLNDIAMLYNAAPGGGGIENYFGAVTLNNSTLSYNEGYHGGGARNDGGMLTLINSTVSGNSSGSGGGLFDTSFGSLTNSILTDNSPENCQSPANDNGNNFSSDASCGPGFAAITPGVDIDTFPANHGGPTQTVALLPGSVAIDAAGDCEVETDQRGRPRDDGACDSGSYEFGS